MLSPRLLECVYNAVVPRRPKLEHHCRQQEGTICYHVGPIQRFRSLITNSMKDLILSHGNHHRMPGR